MWEGVDLTLVHSSSASMSSAVFRGYVYLFTFLFVSFFGSICLMMESPITNISANLPSIVWLFLFTSSSLFAITCLSPLSGLFRLVEFSSSSLLVSRETVSLRTEKRFLVCISKWLLVRAVSLELSIAVGELIFRLLTTFKGPFSSSL